MSERVRVIRSEAEWREIMGRYRASGLSQGRFCEQEGIGKSAFYRWRRILVDGRAGGGKFIEVSAGVVERRGAVELEFPSGLVLRVRG
jgi:hypothetical protein